MAIFDKAVIVSVVLSVTAWASPIMAQEAPTAERDAIEQDRPDDFYCGERRLGQWFYCAKPKPSEEVRPTTSPKETSATDRIAAITRQLDELKARAILDPTEANVINYVRFQREQLFFPNARGG